MSNETTTEPYTVDLSGHWVMTNIGIYREVEHFDLPSQAKIVCEELNAAYLSGRKSIETEKCVHCGRLRSLPDEPNL